MTQRDYILSSANLPFFIGSLEDDADKLFAAVPAKLTAAWSRARGHQESVLAGDDVSDWIGANWRTVLPEVSARFPAKSQ